MLRGISLSGFKRFDSEGVELELAPITLLFGRNSAGKSSLLQAILVVAQSWEHFPSGISRLCPTGPLIDAGRFGQALHREGERSVDSVAIGFRLGSDWIRFRWSDQAASRDGWQDVSESSAGELQRIDVDLPPQGYGFGFIAESAEHPQHRETSDSGRYLDLILPEGSDANGIVRCNITWRVNDQPEDYSVLPVADGEVNQLINRSSPGDGTFIGNAKAAVQRIFGLRGLLRKTTHVAGIRQRGSRVYAPVRSDRAWRVGAVGERLLDVLIEHGEVLVETNDLLRMLEIPYSIDVRAVEGHAELYAIDVVDERSGPSRGNRLGLPDVGSGVGQLLPIIVQMALHKLPREVAGPSLLLWEQPELHLHPRWQARLSRLFTEKPWLSSPAEDPRFQVIAETHSEHFVLGLKNEIEQGRIHHEDALILVFHEDEGRGNTRVTPVRFDEQGRFKDMWPGGFFPERRELQDGGAP